MRWTTRPGVATLAALTLVLAGCSPADPGGTGTDEPGTNETGTNGAGTDAPDGDPDAAWAGIGLPEGPAGEQAAWLVAHLAEPAGTPLPDPEGRFSTEFLAELPAPRLEEVLDQVRGAGPFRPAEAAGSAESVEVRLDGEVLDVLLHVAVDEQGRIAGLWFSEPPPPRPPASSWEDLAEEVDGFAGPSALLVARPEGGVCVPVHVAGTAPDDVLPVGSVVKLWVLLAVVDAVGRGDLAWQDTLTVTDDVRSLPSGELQDTPAGTEVTVEEAARGMIAISDNTATDLLVHAVGRERVVEAMSASGHHDPALNDPFPTTRELFQLGWGGGAPLREAWRDAGAAGRAELLADLPGGALDVDAAAVAGTVVWPARVDWFATAEDVCGVHLALQDRAGTTHGAVVREILSGNPGLGPEAAEWAHVAFKGGSAPGTMAGAWWVEGGDASGATGDGAGGSRSGDGAGGPHVVVLLTASRTPQGALPAATMVAIVEDALRFLRDG